MADFNNRPITQAGVKGAVVVEVYSSELSWQRTQQRFEDCSFRISTEGTLVICKGATTRAIRAYSHGTWHTAWVDERKPLR
jgi:hypothetical protein